MFYLEFCGCFSHYYAHGGIQLFRYGEKLNTANDVLRADARNRDMYPKIDHSLFGVFVIFLIIFLPVYDERKPNALRNYDYVLLYRFIQ